MSIPPLVCSTPPPPDQCEDDKDPEDFDIRYNLSQDEDDEENYDYGSFSTYEHFQSSKSNNDVPIISKVIEDDKVIDTSKEHPDDIEIVLGTKITIESQQKFEEDITLEDLNLKVDQVTLESTDVTVNNQSPVEDKVGSIICDSADHIQETQTTTGASPEKLNPSPEYLNTQPDEHLTDPTNSDPVIDTPEYVDKIVAKEDGQQPPIEPQEHSYVIKDVNTDFESIRHPDERNDELKQALVEDDDFGDFEDFQFASPVNKEVAKIVESCDNPWDNNEVPETDFGDFKASFDDKEIISSNEPDCKREHGSNEPDFKTEHISNEPDCKPEHSTLVQTPKDITEGNDDDDFGDFNDFKSSSIEPTNQSVEDHFEMEYQRMLENISLPDLDSFKNETEMLDYFNNEVNNLYVFDEPEQEELHGTLESTLGVFWGNMLEVETRQPYMVNWNNSLGQQTLLKSLCIDSRNILFGPKWNSNMPKYAANLSVAPLQPQKQAAMPSTSSETVNTEKTASKTSCTWSDPFSSTGQEFTYAETLLLDLEHLMATLDQMANNQSTLKISEILSHACTADTGTENPVIETGPTDLDVFEASTSSKPDKIFSSTISVQPIRQINLPDTHIFTPTDSETPRSTTIHYDSSPSILLPQTGIASKPGPASLTPQSSLQTTTDDDDYWEFQNFKGATDAAVPSTSRQMPATNEKGQANTNVSYGTQVLQPVKIEPMMPTLNWPNPGEVKETFDDFSDFVSNSSLSTQQDVPVAAVQQVDLPHPVSEFDQPGPSTRITLKDNVPHQTVENTDDDFDTFQSALPSTSGLDIGFAHVPTNMSSVKPAASVPMPKAPKIMTDFDKAFLKIDNVKSDTISLGNISRTKINSVQNHIPFFPSSSEGSKNIETPIKFTSMPVSSIPTMNSNLLQPTPATSNIQNQQKSAQILQPLSLESYSQINWPNPGIDLQDLSRFNPVETLNSLKTDLGVNSLNKVGSPVHSKKGATSNQTVDDDIWGEFVSSKPKPQQQAMPKKPTTFVDDDEWTDFVSSPSVKPQNGLNTISLNVHTNLNIKKTSSSKVKVKNNQLPLDIPALNYITPKSSAQKAYNDRHFQNL